MKIGLIVDGQGEVGALPNILDRVETDNEVLRRPLKADMQPLSPPAQIALRAATACEILAAKGVKLAVVLLDLETRDECPGEFAQLLKRLIDKKVDGIGICVEVVIKAKALENWLVADLPCLSNSPALFPDRDRVANTVPAGNADGVNALEILERASGSRRRYDKVSGAVAICKSLHPGRAAVNSRSFRRFLRVLGDRRYVDQSRQAVTVIDTDDTVTSSTVESPRERKRRRRQR
jgi:hypothetical protein